MSLKFTNDKIFGCVLAVILVIGFGFMITKNQIRKEYFNREEFDKRFTIAKITDVVPGAKSPPYFEYEFTFNDNTYSGAYIIESDLRNTSLENLKKYRGDLFFVEFIVDDPDYSRLIFSNGKIEKQSTIPTDGWSKIPNN